MGQDNLKTPPDVDRRIALLMCLLAAGACLGYAYIRKDLPNWWRGYGGGIPYVVFWIMFWFWMFPWKKCIVPICAIAVAATCGLEFLQLWKPDWLMHIRGTRLGAALLGSGFTWSDFPPYFIGGLVGYVALKLVTNRFPLRGHGKSK